MDKNIRKPLKTDYENLEIKPSASLWNQIELGLDNDSETVQKPLFQWWKYAAVIVLLLSFGALFYYNSDRLLKPEEIIAVKKAVESNSKPTENIEVVADNKNEELNNISEIIIKSEKTQKKQSEILVQSQSEVLKETPKMTNAETQISIKSEIEINNKPEQLIPESPQLATAQPAVKEAKVKYITANDLIFQRKYSIEKKENAQENVKRLGIIMINRINVSPEFITIFNGSNNNTSEQK
ncbi:hypothetical protein [Chryseobacterium balustinum]|uniref:Anti-sigma factor n=1 Tax=Chryseobacterium balustinum TaxID=246 RepID=A0AAX2INM8_9FLAO|nr:hypothetical protein [Chryseobacterium balustinum]AZB28984.1 hypothetical protein EB354_06770 [Chryseobacterium balustinum]SKB60991.1 hypothetical protein SAMN05421800_104113 [Chryseobacterium balustinum]SQA91323.1 Uncharacterised protein [Chryseobacterium balustinum]